MKYLKSKKLYFLLGALLLLAVGSAIFFKMNASSAEAVAYDTYQIEKSEDLYLTGKVVAKEQQQIFFDAALGEITTINAVAGSDVKAGDVLLTYSSNSNQLALKEKQALQAQYTTNIANLEQELATAKQRLTKAKKNGDEAEKQAAESEISTAETSLTTYHDQLTDINAQITTLEATTETVVTANFDGKVTVDDTKKNDSSGPVVTLFSNEAEVKATITEYDIEKISLNQEVQLQYTNQNKTTSGAIAFIDSIPNSEAAVANYTIKTTMNEVIPLGYSVTLQIPQNEMFIPLTAVISEDEKHFVYVLEKEQPKKVPVGLELQEEFAKVISGLEAGQTIVKDAAAISTKAGD